MSFEIWTDPMASGGHRAKEIFLDHFGLPSGDPEFEMLRRVVACYSNLPYENLTKIIRKFTASSPDERLRGPVDVVTGYVDHRTGGTCFSLTYCLGSILASAGYRCHPVMADMKRPNIHCALIVELKGRSFLVDPGYLVGEPVELTGRPVRIATTFGVVEIRPRQGERYDLFTLDGPDELAAAGSAASAQSAVGAGAGSAGPAGISSRRCGDRKWRYALKTEPVSHAAFMSHWQDSFSLPMMNSLLLTRLTPSGHLYIKNHHLRMRGVRGKVNENIRSEFERRIAAEFGIPPEITAQAREHLERLRRAWGLRGAEDEQSEPRPRGEDDGRQLRAQEE
jgi:arylamine N-acetyltransferase